VLVFEAFLFFIVDKEALGRVMKNCVAELRMWMIGNIHFSFQFRDLNFSIYFFA